MSKLKKELTAQQVQLKELTKIWVDSGNEITFKRIYDMLFPMIMNYYHRRFKDNGAFLDMAHDTLIDIYNNRNHWKEKGEYPNLQNCSYHFARNKMCNHIKHVYAKKRIFENISFHNPDSISLDMYYDDDNELIDKNNYIEKFCFDNDLFDDCIETDLEVKEKELAQKELLQKCIKYMIDWQSKKKENSREHHSLNVFMDFVDGLTASDIVKKYEMPDDVKSRQHVQHIFYRYKTKLKNLFQDEYNDLMINYGDIETFDGIKDLSM